MANAPGMDVFMRALTFAAECHRGQRRKGGEGSPYINHLIDVADILWRVGGVRDPEILASGLLHDTVEDTETTEADLERLFGEGIAGIVIELTDDMGLARDERRERQVSHAAALSHAAAQIKIADKISNITDIADYPPLGWTDEERCGYVMWGRRVVNELRGTNDALEKMFDDVCARVLNEIKRDT